MYGEKYDSFGGWYISTEISRKTKGAINAFHEMGRQCKEVSGMILSLLMIGFYFIFPQQLGSIFMLVFFLFYVFCCAISISAVVFVLLSEMYPNNVHGKRVRPDFCGWSALGPISLFIENVLGFHDIDASSRTVRWDIRHDCRHGLNNLTFGDTTTDLLYDPAASTVTIRGNKPYCLILNGKSHRIRAGVTTISI